MNQAKHTLFWASNNICIDAETNLSILEALINAGILLRADCGGKGRCGKCGIRILDPVSARVSPPSETEARVLGPKAIGSGSRLACHALVLGDIVIEIPPTTLLEPEVAHKGPTILPPTIGTTPAAPDTPQSYGIAVDLGTTTIAVYLCDLKNRAVKASISLRNPQVIYGDDVMSRITVLYQHQDLLKKIQKMAVKAIEWGIQSLCRSSGIGPAHLKKMVLVGNSTMIHFFVGADPTSIGVFPYEPQFKKEKIFNASEIGFRFNPTTEIHTLPLISGFLGADIIGAVLATELQSLKNGTVLVDVGTNGEVMLVGEAGFSATSCATGPAFEGASIYFGMHAVSGAIDGVHVDPKTGKAICSIIQKDPQNPKKPSGICGSGVVSAVAELYRNGIILKDGRLTKDSFADVFKNDHNDGLEYILLPASEAQSERAITLTQPDVRAIQLAKGALLTGIKLLCQEAGLTNPVRILVAGAFGSYIHKEDALTIGMFPDIGVSNLRIVGNAAGAGAILALLDEAYLKKAHELTRSTKVIDLASHPDFQEVFLNSLAFP